MAKVYELSAEEQKQIGRIVDLVFNFFGGDKVATHKWFFTRHPLLEQRTPIEALHAGKHGDVLRLLGAAPPDKQ